MSTNISIYRIQYNRILEIKKSPCQRDLTGEQINNCTHIVYKTLRRGENASIIASLTTE
jgi:hypothetical protein